MDKEKIEGENKNTEKEVRAPARNGSQSDPGGEVKTTIKKPKKEDSRSGWKYGSIILILIIAFFISLFFYKQRIEVEVLKNLTENWQTFESEKYGFSFKYPKDWKIEDMTGKPVEDPTIDYVIQSSEKKDQNEIRLRIFNMRSVDTGNPEDAIQVSIPFDKRNYLIFSTSTESEDKVIFYNILATLNTTKNKKIIN